MGLKRSLLALALCGGLSLIGCDDNGGSDAGPGGGVDAGPGGGVDAGPGGGTDAGPGGGTDAGPGGGTDAGPGGGTDAGPGGGTDGGGGASAAAEAFCTSYETTCTYGGADRYADEAACLSAYDSYDTTRQACVTQHLGLAAGDTGTHCPHATGMGPCS